MPKKGTNSIAHYRLPHVNLRRALSDVSGSLLGPQLAAPGRHPVSSWALPQVMFIPFNHIRATKRVHFAVPIHRWLYLVALQRIPSVIGHPWFNTLGKKLCPLKSGDSNKGFRLLAGSAPPISIGGARGVHRSIDHGEAEFHQTP